MEIGENLRWKIKKNENGILGEREIRQMGNHEEEYIGKIDIGKKRNWEKE